MRLTSSMVSLHVAQPALNISIFFSYLTAFFESKPFHMRGKPQIRASRTLRHTKRQQFPHLFE